MGVRCGDPGNIVRKFRCRQKPSDVVTVLTNFLPEFGGPTVGQREKCCIIERRGINDLEFAVLLGVAAEKNNIEFRTARLLTESYTLKGDFL